jgi:DNA mismatch repair protein MutS2
VLLDEIGRSTDPQEGSALSLAVIEKLLELHCFTAVTTHLPAIKNLVLSSDPRVAGASVEFDIENAKPLYTIRVGTLGASYAIAIARRLGLDADVLSRAEALILEGGDILKIDMPALEHRLEELERSVAHAKSAKERAQREFGSLVLMERLIVLAALKEAEKITSQAEKKLESALKMASALPHQIDKHEVNEDLGKIREYATRLRRAADALSSPVLASPEPSQETTAESRKAGVEVGSKVWVLSLRREGELVEMGPKRATVIIGGKRMQVSMDQVQPLEPQDAAKGKVLKTHTPPQKSLPLFIDLHGMTVEDAIHVLEPYLDEAYYQGREHAHVIHGFGTGALRKGLHEYLQKHPLVASFEFADVDQGGAGVTIVKLKRGK